MKFQTKLSGFLFILSMVLLTGCQKETTELQEDAAHSQVADGNASTEISLRSEEPCLSPYFEVFSNHFKNFRGVDPGIYFPDETYDDYRTRLNAEVQNIETVGFSQYLNQLHADRKISSDSKSLMLHIYESVNVENDVIIDDLKSDLITNFNPASLEEYDPFFCYVYNIALEIYNEYYGGHDGNTIELRGDCDFKDFVEHVIKYAGAGAAIGGIAGSIIQELDSLFIIQVIGLSGAAAI